MVLLFTGAGRVNLNTRLDRGPFAPLRCHEAETPNCLTLSLEDLRLLLEGIELSSIKRRARWYRPESKQIATISNKSS